MVPAKQSRRSAIATVPYLSTTTFSHHPFPSRPVTLSQDGIDGRSDRDHLRRDACRSTGIRPERPPRQSLRSPCLCFPTIRNFTILTGLSRPSSLKLFNLLSRHRHTDPSPRPRPALSRPLPVRCLPLPQHHHGTTLPTPIPRDSPSEKRGSQSHPYDPLESEAVEQEGEKEEEEEGEGRCHITPRCYRCELVRRIWVGLGMMHLGLSGGRRGRRVGVGSRMGIGGSGGGWAEVTRAHTIGVLPSSEFTPSPSSPQSMSGN